MAVNMVHVHHEGAGSPTTAANCARFSEGGYCYGIGTDTYVRWRTPEQNYATADWNHRDWTPCFSGNRMTAHVTDNDLTILHNAFMDAYNRGEVTATPDVVAHRNAGGSNATSCPGDLTMARWDDVVAACRATPTPAPTPEPEDDVTDLASAINHDGRPIVFQVGGDKKLYYRVRNQAATAWGNWTDLSDGKTNFATVTAFTNPDSHRVEVWVTMVDGHTFNRAQNPPDMASWGPWYDHTIA